VSNFKVANWGDVNLPESIVPNSTGKIRKIMIKDKLKALGFSDKHITLGNFDYIGEYTAKKSRQPGSELYSSVGCFFRPNYERGILIHALIKKYQIKSFLEIGFGRGYSTLCAAMAMHENGFGKITTVDPTFDKQHLEKLKNIFPEEWFSRIDFIEQPSQVFLESEKAEKQYNFIYIDGDHTYHAVKRDWELSKDRYTDLLLFDDYHLPTKESGPGIQCSSLIDQIQDDSKELIIMDRRIFLDDRGYSDDQIDYGQVLLTKGVS